MKQPILDISTFLFRENFEQLQLRFYQLDRLVEKRLPDLWQVKD